MGVLVGLVIANPDGIVEIAEWQGEIAAMVYLGTAHKSGHRVGPTATAALTRALTAALGVQP
jgi:hypothetical protein